MQNMNKGDLDEIFGILNITKNVTADEMMFAAIAGFCERFICSNVVYVFLVVDQHPKETAGCPGRC